MISQIGRNYNTFPKISEFALVARVIRQKRKLKVDFLGQDSVLLGKSGTARVRSDARVENVKSDVGEKRGGKLEIVIFLCMLGGRVVRR